ncbi:hypothetical protein BDV98DRAFT_565438 [Pterulicium gracile]|uniref:Uncharacterized protein n=1 Tax=Pterulicium gracile TaxID=1884261 RepID=A0A5C3QMB5_9AGAR|nr:hypothetical protein BDV98DRAFT_565438 [Pterula gracilis]
MPNSPDNRRPYAEYEERNGVYPGSFSDIYQPEVSYHSSSMPGGFYTPDEGLDELVDEFGYRVTTQDEGSSVWPAPGPGSSTQDLPLGFSPFPPPSERYTRSRTTAPGASSSSRTLPSSRTIPSTTSRPRSSAERRTQSSADYSDRRRSIAAIHPNGRARGSAADEVIVYEAPHEALAPVSSRLELPVYTGPESIYALSPVSTPAPASRTRPHVNLRVDTSRTSEGSRRSSINSWDTVSNPRSDNSLGLNMMDFNAGYGAAGGRHQTSRRGSRSSLSSELSQSAVAHSFLQPSARDSTNSRRGSQTYQGGVPTIEEEDSPVEDQGFDDYRFGGHGHGRTGFEAFDPIPPPLSNESSRTIVPGLGHRSYSSQDASSASASQEQRRNARRTASYDSWNTSMGYAQAVDQTDDSSGIHNQPRRGHGNSLGLDLGEPEIAHPRPGYARGGIGYDSQAMRMLPGSPSRQHTASARVTQASW